MTDPDPGLRSGFVTVVGRPNVGKSSLVNRILGEKVTITSPRPHTTRRPVRGVLHRPGVQAVFVDTPGLHRPRSPLGQRLNEHVAEALDDVDVVVAVVDATMKVGPGDRLVLARAAAGAGPPRPGAPGGLLVAVNKVDVAGRARTLERLGEAEAAVTAAAPGTAVEFFPVSARTGRGVPALVAAVTDRLGPGPPYFPDDMVSDVPEAFWVAELVREQLLAALHDELPHAIACRVTEWSWPHVTVEILVERDSQKGIVIGHGGSVLKAVGQAVRGQMAPGAYLELKVKVERAWPRRPEMVERLGY